ncbi:MAG TPA: right-handed parallel beta-helix repeat-containing protein, partial [Bacteroidales bacterium]|nr:right-handed parallel beta-helix repeat-containing protein [Bacteroidales bacterium]
MRYKTDICHTFSRNDMKRFWIVFVIGMILLSGISCRDEDYITDPEAVLSFSTDTISFDTIFTSIGSTTKQLKIYNPHKQAIRISQIYLGQGDNSYFRLNIDGNVTDHANDIEIPSKDSLFIFIEVTIDPFGVNNPMVINDSIVFVANGNVQDVNLIAYGQDVHLIDGELIESQTWIADKPYLIYHSMGVDSARTLTIEAGVKLFFHEGSQLIVLGSLIANGTKENPVIFRGDRLDEVLPDLSYDKIPDQWGGIVIYPYSRGNRLNYCHIRNAEIGIFLPGVIGYDYQSEIEIRNSIIENNSFAGIYAFNASVTAFNCLIVNCGTYTFAGITGG